MWERLELSAKSEPPLILSQGERCSTTQSSGLALSRRNSSMNVAEPARQKIAWIGISINLMGTAHFNREAPIKDSRRAAASLYQNLLRRDQSLARRIRRLITNGHLQTSKNSWTKSTPFTLTRESASLTGPLLPANLM